ncbi:putative cyclin-F1-1 [Dirofilaria immitis]|nr:hypothetical protein [Dirofilaria immitis]
MSISCSTLHQIVQPLNRSSDDDLTNGTFNSNDTSSSSMDSLIASQRDRLELRIQQRLEASRQGMLQLEALRSKHQKLMQEIRIRLSHRNDRERSCDSYGKQKESLNVNSQTEIKPNDLRCDSPVSCSLSHRSSVSMDSGCVSLSSDFSSQSSMPSNANRNFSSENQHKEIEQNSTIETDESQQLVTMAIKSTTALCCQGKKCCTNWPRPKSICINCSNENSVVVDSLSFSQITPPPIHRKFFAVGRTENVQIRRPCVATSCIDIHSPILLQKKRSPIHLPVNQPPVLHAKPISISLSSKIPSSPYMRIKDSQKSLQNSRLIQHYGGNQSIFHASRIFVDRSSHIVQYPKQCKNIERYDSDEESSQLLRAQPAVVLSRQQSYVHSNESSPCELRKVHFIKSSHSLSNAAILECHQQFNRCESSQSSESIVSDRIYRRKKEKDWKESEDL